MDRAACNGGARGAYTLFQVLAFIECTIALLLRGRKPVGALAGTLVVYALADLDAIMILPVCCARTLAILLGWCFVLLRLLSGTR